MLFSRFARSFCFVLTSGVLVCLSILYPRIGYITMHCITLFYTKITLFIPALYGLHTSKHRRLSTLLNINFMPKSTIKPAEIPTGFYRADISIRYHLSSQVLSIITRWRIVRHCYAAPCADLTVCVAVRYPTLRIGWERHGRKNSLPFPCFGAVAGLWYAPD